MEPGKGKGKKRSPKKMEMTASLNVACLKRLLPIGLNMFGGREQDLIQQSKQMHIDVCFIILCFCCFSFIIFVYPVQFNID